MLLALLVLNRHYPHGPAGQLAASAFAVVAAIAGIAVAIIMPGAPDPVPNAALWAAAGAFAAFLVFASNPPRPRPGSVYQGAVADGVVAGILIGASTSFLDLVLASGAGAGSDHPITAIAVAGWLAVCGITGGIVGAGVGYLCVLLGGADRFNRPYPVARARKKKRSRRR